MRDFVHRLRWRLRPDDSDDFDWSRYHLTYRRQIEELEQTGLLKLGADSASMTDGRLEVNAGFPPMHPNHVCLYETIGALGARSVIEIGCGGGDHLHNLGVLFPDMDRRGFDRSAEQLAFLARRNPELRELAGILDITMPPSCLFPTADVVYTQAVIMHIQAGNGHRVALANMFGMASEQVVLMENWTRHAFVDDIRALDQGGMLPWQPNLYLRRSAGKPHLLVASRTELPFEPLADYRQLAEAVDESR